MADDDYLLSNSWAPPCLTKIKICRDICEYSTPCKAVGRCGTNWGEERRKMLFMVAAAVAFIAMILTATSLAAITYDAAILRNVYWASGTGTATAVVGSETVTGEFEVFLGLNMQVVDAVIDGVSVSNKTAWSDIGCIDETCDNCKSAATAMVTGMILALITCVPTIQTDIQRSRSEWDMNCQKFLAQFMSNGAGLIGTLLSLSAFSSSCYRHVPSTITVCNNGAQTCVTAQNVSWGLGPGFILAVVATLLKLFDAAVHILVPTPPRCSRPKHELQQLPVQQRMTEDTEEKLEGSKEDTLQTSPEV